MRALFITPSLGAGGAERHWSILLPGLRRRGIDARLIALEGGGPFVEPLTDGGVPLEVLGMRHQADLRPLACSPLLRGFAPDVIVSRSVSALYVGHLVAMLRRLPHVFNEHRGAGLALSPRREAMVRLVAKHVDLVIAVSPDQASAAIERHFRPDRVVVISNGVPAPRVNESRAESRRQLGIPEAAVVAVLVASLRPEKRVPDFAQAVLSARRSCPELVGLIVGEGSERSSVELLTQGGSGVRLLGHRDDVQRILAATDVFVLASEHEAVPMALLEAMAAGLPVLATGVGGIPAIVSDGESGFLVPPRDPEAMAAKLAQLGADPHLRRSMGRTGARLHREHWQAEAMIDGYARVLTELGARDRRWLRLRRTNARPLPTAHR
jgi:glycosyltransferase involved in cell wall biosynthesis